MFMSFMINTNLIHWCIFVAYKLYKPRCDNTTPGNFFVKRVVNMWKALPCTVNFSSLTGFKMSIERIDFSMYLNCIKWCFTGIVIVICIMYRAAVSAGYTMPCCPTHPLPFLVCFYCTWINVCMYTDAHQSPKSVWTVQLLRNWKRSGLQTAEFWILMVIAQFVVLTCITYQAIVFHLSVFICSAV